MLDTVPPLTAVTLLFRAKDQFTDLPHVVTSVSLLLDSSVELPLDVACARGSTKLLDRIWKSSEIFVKNTDLDTPWTLRKYIRTDENYRQYQFNNSLCAAVEKENMEMVKWLSDKFQGCVVKSEVLEKAAEMGSKQILQFFLDNDSSSLLGRGGNRNAKLGHAVEWNGTLMRHAVLNRHGHLAWWLERHLPNVSHEKEPAPACAVKNGDIPLAEWLLSKGADLSPRLGGIIARNAAADGQLDVLQWINRRYDVEGVAGLILIAATSMFDEDTYESLTSFGGEAGLAVHAAAVNGHLQVAKFLRAQVKVPVNSMQRAMQMEENRLRLQKLSRTLGATNGSLVVSAKTMTGAARNGHLDVIKWLCTEFGDDPDIDLFDCGGVKSASGAIAMDEVAGNGHLNVVKHLHELQVQLGATANKRKRDQVKKRSSPRCTAAAMTKAASNGHLEVVKCLHASRSEGCFAHASDDAATNGHLEVVKWTLQHQVGRCTTTEAMDGAAHDGHSQVVKWLHFNTRTVCTTSALDNAASNEILEVVQWLHENRQESCTTDAMDAAAEIGSLAVIKWLHQNRTECCTQTAMHNAARRGHLRAFAQAPRRNLFRRSHERCSHRWQL